MTENTKEIDLKLNNLRKSKNRDMVLDLLSKIDYPVSIETIFNKLKKENSSLALSTVYRIIDKLHQLNIVHEVIKDGDKSMYELHKHAHTHYIMCTKCKKVVPIDICPFQELENTITSKTGFRITTHKFELYGECPNCKG